MIKFCKAFACGALLIAFSLMNVAPAIATASESTNVSITRHFSLQDTYETDEITKPKDILNTRFDIINAINYNVTKLNANFSLKVKDFEPTMLSFTNDEIEHYFISNIFVGSPKKLENNTTQIDFKVSYNDAGRALLFVNSSNATSSDSRPSELIKVASEITSKVEGKSDYDKAVLLHDALVKLCTYATQDEPDNCNAYGVLINNSATSEGYAEAIQLLYTLAGLENRFVYSNSIAQDGFAHYFNKVKIDGQWYIVDAAVDDPGFEQNSSNKIRRDYLLVTDKVAKQRYVWDESRYPASTDDNNWHKRNGLLAKNQKELEKLVETCVENKDEFISIWVDNYSSANYDFSFLKKNTDISKYDIRITASSIKNTEIATAIFFEFEY